MKVLHFYMFHDTSKHCLDNYTLLRNGYCGNVGDMETKVCTGLQRSKLRQKQGTAVYSCTLGVLR